MSETPQERATIALKEWADDALYLEDWAPTNGLVQALQEIAAMPTQPCPHIRGTDEGSHWCALAEQGAPHAVEENTTLRAEVERLREALSDAIDDVIDWSAYADEYFQDKHDLAGTIARHRAALAADGGRND